MGLVISKMDKSWDLLEYLKDPMHVWRFQQYFGVEKVKIVEKRKGGKFYPKNVADIRPKGVQQEALSSDEEYLSSSGEEESETNVIFYRLNSLVWYYIFLLGTQLGDETYYSIFFSFWFWNIDGAVGRRVILVWNLVMYIGQGMKDIALGKAFNAPSHSIRIQVGFGIWYAINSCYDWSGYTYQYHDISIWTLHVSFLAVGNDRFVLVYTGQYKPPILGHALIC